MPAFNPHEIFPSGAHSVPQLRTTAKKWAKENKNISSSQLAKLVTALLKQPSSLQKCMAGILLGYMKEQRSSLDPLLYDQWLQHTSGWNEVDAICYANFTSNEMLQNFKIWEQLIENLSSSDNINKRRASMVLLAKPVTQSNDKQLLVLSLKIIERLQHEKEILITKAVSWLLRSLLKHHAAEVKIFLSRNKDSLPKVAIRETMNKLITGRKNR